MLFEIEEKIDKFVQLHGPEDMENFLHQQI